MTTTTPSLGHSSSLTGRRYSHAFDQFVAGLGIAMLRWAHSRSQRRAFTSETMSTLRLVEADRAARELAAQRLASMRVH